MGRVHRPAVGLLDSRHDPAAPGLVYPDYWCCVAYLTSRKQMARSSRELEIAILNLNDAFLLRNYTPDEVKATSKGRQMYLYPNGRPPGFQIPDRPGSTGSSRALTTGKLPPV